MALGCVFRMRKEAFFIPLCVASTFPNIVALPIIIFPTLCEYDVVQDLARENTGDDENVDMLAVCNEQVNAVVFTYFFGFSVVFWSIGHRTLRNIKHHRDIDTTTAISATNCSTGFSEETILPSSRNDEQETKQSGFCERFKTRHKSFWCFVKTIVVDVITSSGFVALILGFIVSCIEPLQRALFDNGRSLRVIGSALESLSNAGTTFATIVVAASLVTRKKDANRVENEDSDQDSGERDDILGSTMNTNIERTDEKEDAEMIIETPKNEESNSAKTYVKDCQEKKSPIIARFKSVDGKTWRICIWQILSRLLVTPAIVFALLLRLDCSGFLDTIPHIAKLVLLINSAVPGALVVVVILKAEGLTEEAAAVSKTYLPSYTFSVFTLAMWSSLGLMAFRPDAGICQQ